jgi:holo-[acyl-carrier protein] synthase
MIVGIGTDIVEVARIDALFARRGNSLAERILAPGEMAELAKQQFPARYIAKRFAAKEAALKALGTGLRNGIRWADVEVTHDELGKPLLKLGGAAAERLAVLRRQFSDVSHAPSSAEHSLQMSTHLNTHITLSDEQHYVVAFVIIERS